jgi:hypothetical protein
VPPVPSNLSTCAASRNSKGLLVVFCVWEDRSIRYVHQRESGGWSEWASLGGSHRSVPAVVLSRTGRLYAFSRNDGDALWYAFQKSPSTGWSKWTPFGTELEGAPTAASENDGRLAVFGRILDGQIRYYRQKAVDGGFPDGTSLGGDSAGAPAVDQNRDGSHELFAISSVGGKLRTL